ncbi:MAG: YdhR family protein [Desulfobacterales bacterium]|jgi:hypothetical protein
MPGRVLQINFKTNVSAEEFQKEALQIANDVANVPGLRWKIWIVNEETSEAGGLYLFDDQASVEAYLAGPIVADLKSKPPVIEISFKQFNVVDDNTAITRGPV